MTEKPVILIGSPRDMNSLGDGSANGGIKSHNLWVKLLRQHGYRAFVVTYDGSRVDWMTEHAEPYISIDEARGIVLNTPTRVMTTAPWATAMFDLAEKTYFYDQELKFTSDYAHQRGILERFLADGRFAGLATHSRTMQAWYMTSYGVTPTLINEWSDTAYWRPYPDKRILNRVGWMDEGAETASDIECIRQICVESGVTPEFIQIGGPEPQVIDMMQSCDLFLGLGRGKHALFGEGSNRSGQEAQHAGCVVIMYDQHGNREYMLHKYTGFLTPIGNVQDVAEWIVMCLQNRTATEWVRTNSIDYAMNYFNAEMRWDTICDFLNLEP